MSCAEILRNSANGLACALARMAVDRCYGKNWGGKDEEGQMAQVITAIVKCQKLAQKKKCYSLEAL
jgi:hypothetical protein